MRGFPSHKRSQLNAIATDDGVVARPEQGGFDLDLDPLAREAAYGLRDLPQRVGGSAADVEDLSRVVRL